MKFKNRILTVAMLTLAVAAMAALPTYKTVSATGTTAAIAYFPANPNGQVRVVNYNATSDNATGQVYFATGTTAFEEVATNAASSSVTNWVNSTNGLLNGSALLLQHAGTCYPATLSSYGSYLTGTNTFGQQVYSPFIVLGSGGWGVNTSVGDDIYVMTNNITIGLGDTTATGDGEAIFVGNYGRPVAMTVTGHSACSINAASAHYDAQSQ